MRALIVASGTRGDVQPALALAHRLRQLDHSARLCVPPNFLAWARELGFEALQMGVEMRLPKENNGRSLTLTADELRRLRESLPDLIADQFETIASAVPGCDVIVGVNAHQYAAPSIAEYAGVGCVTAVLAPVAIPSTDHWPPPTPGHETVAPRPPSIEENWRAISRTWNERALERVNRNRRRFGLRHIDDVLEYALTDHTWLAADRMLAPAPSTERRTLFQTGSWNLPGESSLPADLEVFLRAGPPPIYVGFGSMPAAHFVSRATIDAVREVGHRVVLSAGWADLGAIDGAPDCIVIGDVNHDLLFPQVAAVVHHGGAGTTTAAARAGVPQVLTPIFGISSTGPSESRF